MLGETIARYRIGEKTGSGGMGGVYLAEDPQLDRPVAIKILREEYVSDLSRLSRFVNEAKAASALSHSHTSMTGIGRRLNVGLTFFFPRRYDEAIEHL